MEIKIIYGIDFEINRIKYTLGKLKWYLDRGHNPLLPLGTTAGDSEETVLDALKKEYKEGQYAVVSSKLASDLVYHKEEFEQRLSMIFPNDIPQNIEVILTMYGVGGAYTTPNMVLYNMKTENGIKTIVHQIVHLIIEKYIQEYKINFWEKERIVDLILNSEQFSFLKYESWQTDYHQVEAYIDPWFAESFFASPVEFFSKVEEKRTAALNPPMPEPASPATDSSAPKEEGFLPEIISILPPEDSSPK